MLIKKESRAFAFEYVRARAVRGLVAPAQPGQWQRHLISTTTITTRPQ